MQTREVAEVELRQQNLRLEARCDDYEKSIQKIQPKYQEALNDQGRFQHEISEALVRENSVRQKLDASTGEIAKLHEKNAAAGVELSAARVSLSTSAIPEIAEFNKLKGEMDAMRAENDRLQKRVTNLQSEIEYMRGHYQQASSSAAEAAIKVDTLEEENAKLKVKASDNARKIHEIQASNEIQLYLQRIEALGAEKGEIERELDRKTEELRAMLNGRRTTRGTSVPRSPRMPTMSPNVRERPMARVISSGVGSRGNSPAPGEYAPARGQFGDALFAERGSGNGRFGNHLY
jgi:chromosome segregation ATPase